MKKTNQLNPDWSLEQDQMLVSLYNSGLSLPNIVGKLNAKFPKIKRTEDGSAFRIYRLRKTLKKEGYLKGAQEKVKVEGGTAFRQRLPERSLIELYQKPKEKKEVKAPQPKEVVKMRQKLGKEIDKILTKARETKSIWTKDQDAILIELRKDGMVFPKIALDLNHKFPEGKRTWDHCRNRFQRLQKASKQEGKRERSSVTKKRGDKKERTVTKTERGGKREHTMTKAVILVMGSKIMGTKEVAAGLKEKGWTPESTNIRGYISEVFSVGLKKGTFEKVKRGRYRVVHPKKAVAQPIESAVDIFTAQGLPERIFDEAPKKEKRKPAKSNGASKSYKAFCGISEIDSATVLLGGAFNNERLRAAADKFIESLIVRS